MNDSIPDCDRDELRCIAYHEAGHAAIAWFFGRRIKCVQMDRKGLSGGVVSEAFGFLDPDKVDGEGQPLVCDMRAGKQWCMILLAGTAAESRVEYDSLLPEVKKRHLEFQRALLALSARSGAGLPPPWFMACSGGSSDMDESDDSTLLPHGGLLDFDEARAITRTLVGESESESLLEHMASWTEEAISHPRMWAVVDALAQRLQESKRGVSGQTAVKTMWNAWGGPSTGLPYMQIDPKWQERFPVSEHPSSEQA